MTQEAKLAFIIAMSARLQVEIAAMQAENICRADAGKAPAYDENSFMILLNGNEYKELLYNGVIEFMGVNYPAKA